MPNTAPLQQAVQQCRMLRAFTCRQLGHGSPGSPGAAPRTVVVRSQSNRRYSSRYTRDDTQEINSRRSTSSWEEDKDYSSRDSWSNADQDARAWERDNYYDDREGSRTETNSWSSGYDERRYDDDRSYTNRDDRYSSSYNGGNGSSSSSSWGGYERDAPSSSPSSSSSWGDYGSSSSSGYGGSSSSSGYGGYDSYSRSSSYDRPTPTYPGFSDIMSFTGSAPEILNGRLAMLEIVSAEPVAIQFWEAPVPILSAIGTVTVASLMPILRDAPSRGYGPLTPYVELVNARSAMVGFALLIIIETFTGRALFAL